MIDKIRSAEKAVEGIEDGMSILLGGFGGIGAAEILLDALIDKGVRHLTVIGIDGGLRTRDGQQCRGAARLLAAGMVDHLIVSHIGLNPLAGQLIHEGRIRCTMIPQGTLVERIRAGGAGLGGIITPVGVGTAAEGKRDITIKGRRYVVEEALRGEYAFVRASHCDKAGNFMSAKTTKNLNYVIAMAADNVLVASEEVHEVGEKDPDFYHMPGIFVKYVIGGERAWTS